MSIQTEKKIQRDIEKQTSIKSRLEPISFETNLTSIITEDARILLTLSDTRLKTDTTIITDRQIKQIRLLYFLLREYCHVAFLLTPLRQHHLRDDRR